MNKLHERKEINFPFLKFDLKMKLTVLLVFTSFFSMLASTGYSQSITLDVQNTTVEKIIDKIEVTSKYTFVYNTKFVDLHRKISINGKDVLIEKVLSKLFDGTKTSYEVIDAEIFLKESIIINDRLDKSSSSIISQEFDIKGTITDIDGQPLSGANILEKGTTNGTLADFDGNFSIKVTDSNAILVISYIGFTTKEIIVGDQNNISVILEESAAGLDEVVITALGISREKKSLTYSAQEVSNDDLTKVKQINVINSLSGKTAGLTISRSASGVGGTSKVVIRGNSSTTNNTPLYVVDGIPLSDFGNGFDASNGDDAIFGASTGNRDGGDAMSLINPDDIETITVLKGASAAALYGSQGANGVILITTKSGKDGKISVQFNSSITVDDVISLPKLQSDYQSNSVGQPVAKNGNVTDPRSWGAKTPGLSNDFIDGFFNTGVTSIQSLVLSAGTKKAQTYFSYANTYASGVIPENNLKRNNVSFRETANFLDNKIQISASINLNDQRIHNRPTTGISSNPLTGLYLNPVGIDLNAYKNKFEYFNESQNMMNQYAVLVDNVQSNPYWVINRQPSDDIVQRVVASVSANFAVTKDFSLKTRGSYDKAFFTYDKKYFGSSSPNFVAETGRYILEKTENTQQYIDLIASYTPRISDNFTFSGLVGTSLTKSSIGDQLTLDSGSGATGGLTYANEFTIGNFVNSSSISQQVRNKEVQSLFGSANFGYNNILFLDVTGRADWSSTLVNTTSSSFFYPSVGLTAIVSKMLNMQGGIFGKVRLSYAEVGKDIPIYATIPLGTITNEQNTINRPTFGVRQGETLRPEKQKSFEIGTEWNFFNNRLGLDFTYYDSKTSDQIFFITAEPNVQGFTQNIVNAGEISNKGIELVLKAKPFVNEEGFNWDTAINFATNENKVVSVHPDLENGEAIINIVGSPNGYGYSLIAGEDFGSIRGFSVKRNTNGIPLVNNDGGNLSLNKTDASTIANPQPDFTLGWKNSFTYKNLSLEFLIDAKIGGNVVSATEAINDFYGVSQATADARNTNGGFIDVVDQDGNQQQMTAEAYYTQIGGRDGIYGEYVYDATNVSLREFSIGYNLPLQSSFIENMRLSLIGSNLLFFYKDAPFDPNITSSTGIGVQGVDVYGQPSTRSLGLNINIKF